MSKRTEIDHTLWVWSTSTGLGWLVGRSHVPDPSRFLVHWADHGDAYGCSLYELTSCSRESSIWLDGFLSAAEPQAWFEDPYFAYDESDPRTHAWRAAAALFHRTGVWDPGRTCEVCGKILLPSAPIGRPLCVEHHPRTVDGDYLGSFPTVAKEPPAQHTSE